MCERVWDVFQSVGRRWRVKSQKKEKERKKRKLRSHPPNDKIPIKEINLGLKKEKMTKKWPMKKQKLKKNRKPATVKVKRFHLLILRLKQRLQSLWRSGIGPIPFKTCLTTSSIS